MNQSSIPLLKLNNISWSSFEESDLKISIPEGIDVVYH